MRLYSITNFYISSIQQGIQTQHSTVDLMRKYKDDEEKLDFINDWADNHKTTIVLNGGAHDDLQDLLYFLGYTCDFPFVEFREPGLNNALTSISFVFDEPFYEMMSAYRSRLITEEDIRSQYSEKTTELLIRLSPLGLAR